LDVDVPQHSEEKWKENQKDLICEVVKEQLKMVMLMNFKIRKSGYEEEQNGFQL
jgi:hypothetical protein